MNILMLGNGFDLYHKLPTTYLSFLKTMEFVLSEKDIPLALGYVFMSLQKECDTIDNSYSEYKEFYDKYFFDEVDKVVLSKLKVKIYSNYWLNYFIKSYNKNVGWIDFEKEIAYVINEFEKAIGYNEKNKFLYSRRKNQVHSNNFNHTIQQFDFFFDAINHQKPFNIKEQYIVETPFGSDNYSINKDKIISKLFTSLKELSEALKIYLYIFVEKPLKRMKEQDIINLNESFCNFKEVLTFNYTSTYETLYGEAHIKYIHGDLDSNIVLGINPDDKDDFSDDMNEPDTSYIMFKKYYQRVYYRTDTDFIELINSIKSGRNTKNFVHNNLVVCGHSLDITDRDIIKEVFDISDSIYVICHELEEIGKYVSNLIHIYGKNEFDKIRTEKQLKFITYEEWKDVTFYEPRVQVVAY